MKILKTKPQLIFTVSYPTIALSILIYCLCQSTVPAFCMINILFLLACFTISITSQSKKKLGAENNPLIKTLLKIASIQILCLLIYLGFFRLLLHLTYPNSTTIKTPLKITLVQYGLFPWAAWALLSVGLARRAFLHQQPARFSDLAPKRFNQPDSLPQIALNSHFNTVNHFCLGFNLSIFAFYLIHVFFSMPIIALINPSSLTCVFFILVTILIIRKIRLFYFQTFKSINLWFCLIISSACLSLLTGLMYGLVGSLTTASIHPPAILQYVNQFPQHTTVLIGSLFYWLLWTPMISSYLAPLLRGLSSRQALICLLTFPFFLCLFFLLINPTTTAHMEHWISFNNALAPISAVAFVILLLLRTLPSKKNTLVTNTLPPSSQFKFRPHSRLLEASLIIMCFMVVFLLLEGIKLTNFILFATGLPLLFYLLLISFNLSLSYLRPNHKKTASKGS
jgi:choline-glycine betaine transporter